jgi:catechol 2,3-dioxygenase
MSLSVIGTVYLRVANRERMLAFYRDIIGLKLHRQEDNVAYLGAGGDDLLALIESPDSKRVTGTTGLYHFALLVPSRYDLARSLQRIADTNTALQGLSDHYVSEAIYLADPEGNGIEIYRDRPTHDWYRDGQFRMGTIPMDVEGVLGSLEGQTPTWTGLHSDTIMGHIHLHVAAIPETEAFYRDLLGMDVMVNVGSATFMSYNGYHHHIGGNIWAGQTPPPPDALGLDRYVLQVTDNDQLDTILTHLDQANVPIEEQDKGYLIQDPAQNRIVLAAAGA